MEELIFEARKCFTFVPGREFHFHIQVITAIHENLSQYIQ